MAATQQGISGLQLPAGVDIKGAVKPGYDRVLTAEALAFVAALAREFEPRRRQLMEWREHRQQALDQGALPDFLPETVDIREGDWTIRGIPQDLLDRRVEITGPTSRKMVVNALNSGASCFMADFEDALSPTWDNIVDGQINLADYWLGQVDFTEAETGKDYKITGKPAVLIVRPRGWHLLEEHILVDGQPVAGAFVDFGLYLFHNAKRMLQKGSGPYFYLPKIEHHAEAALWNDVFVRAQNALGLPRRHDQGHGADRDAASGVRDARDPSRHARPHRRAELRPLGLYFLLHQDAQGQARISPSRPQPGRHGPGLSQGVFGAIDQDLP